MAEFFHAGRTNTEDSYDAGKHVHGSRRRVYGHDDVGRSRRPAYAYADDCYNGAEVGSALAAAAAASSAPKERRAHDDHFCHHH